MSKTESLFVSVTKPFDLRELLAIVVVETEAVAPRPASPAATLPPAKAGTASAGVMSPPLRQVCGEPTVEGEGVCVSGYDL